MEKLLCKRFSNIHAYPKGVLISTVRERIDHWSLKVRLKKVNAKYSRSRRSLLYEKCYNMILKIIYNSFQSRRCWIFGKIVLLTASTWIRLYYIYNSSIEPPFSFKPMPTIAKFVSRLRTPATLLHMKYSL